MASAGVCIDWAQQDVIKLVPVWMFESWVCASVWFLKWGEKPINNFPTDNTSYLIEFSQQALKYDFAHPLLHASLVSVGVRGEEYHKGL